jgi:hypothetical protein
MRSRDVLVLVAAMILAGCATSSETVLPSGARGYSISCSGSALTWAQCYQKAGDLCPRGYKIVEQEGQAPGATVVASPTALFGGPIVDRTMLVQCKAAQQPGEAASH